MTEKTCEYSLIKRTKDSIELSVIFHEDYPYFDGHFDDYKILPALLQVNFLVERVNELFEEVEAISEIQTMKFQRPITPELQVSVLITRVENKFSFKYFCADQIYSQGVFRV
jgi:3-hydroxymyristoyl/3-hydroxydecanoyl-(acyl carrier protein) dehydratase